MRQASPRLLSLVPVVTALLSAAPAAARQVPVDQQLRQAQQALQQQNPARADSLLRGVLAQDSTNARAWNMLGVALRRRDRTEEAIMAHRRALTQPQIRGAAMYQLGITYARASSPDSAFHWLQQAKASGSVNVTNVGTDPDARSLRDDRRWTALFPSPAEFAAPFTEPSRIIREWRGEAEGDQFGWIARNIGDVDGDGIADVVTSAPTHAAGAGKVYVYSAKSGKLLWSALGDSAASLGIGIEAAGDVNADGVPDVIAGAPGTDEAFVYSGSDGTVLLRLEGETQGDAFGTRVSDTGDLDGDGHDDVLVTSPGNDAAGENAGRAYVYSGRDATLLATFDGEAAGDGFGSAIAGGDGFVVVGAGSAGPSRTGRTYVFRGLDGAPAFVIEQEEGSGALGGMFVSVLGDVDADGTSDIYASDWAHRALGPSTGRIYVHSGRTGERLKALTGEAAGDGFGIGPADAGDVDGDGHADLIIGAWQHSSSAPSGGKVYLYSGKSFDLVRAWTGQVPGETFGFDATGMGDVDGDGVSDFLLTSAWSAVAGAQSGRMFIVSGK